MNDTRLHSPYSPDCHQLVPLHTLDVVFFFYYFKAQSYYKSLARLATRTCWFLGLVDFSKLNQFCRMTRAISNPATPRRRLGCQAPKRRRKEAASGGKRSCLEKRRRPCEAQNCIIRSSIKLQKPYEISNLTHVLK